MTTLSVDQALIKAKSYIKKNELQNKVENILNLANKFGFNHIETAKYYGTSEVQLGMGFKSTNNIPKIIAETGPNFCTNEA